MAYQTFPFSFVTTDGIKKLATFDTFSTSWYSGSASSYKEDRGYSEGCFDLTDTINSVWNGNTVDETITLSNGNYIKISGEPSSLHNGTLAVRFYDKNDVHYSSLGFYSTWGKDSPWSILVWGFFEDDETNQIGRYKVEGTSSLNYVTTDIWYGPNAKMASDFHTFFDGAIPSPTPCVKIKWTDPPDILTNEPVPCTWAGTVVVRKEGSAPRHRWDGTLIVDSTTRDEYKTNALIDNTVDVDKTYYYGIFPYHIYLDDSSYPIKHYRYTKVVKVETKTSGIYEFDYTGDVQIFVVPNDGVYKLEVWGASCGVIHSTPEALQYGLGGYSVGEIALNKNDVLYIAVGGEGELGKINYETSNGGWNGGGGGGSGYESNYAGGTAGGGATHIAKTTNRGELKNYSNHRNEIIIVAGGGGGFSGWAWGLENYTPGIQCAGGYQGNNGFISSGQTAATGGGQNDGYAFGLGETGSNGTHGSGSGEGRGGGGGGWYGGHAKTDTGSGNYKNAGGGGGSGYIGSTLLSNKKMVGYNVPTSSAGDTKTESVSVFSTNAESDKAKSGPGFARIKFLGGFQTKDFLELKKYSNISDQIYRQRSDTEISVLSEYYLTDNILCVGQHADTRWSFDSVDNSINKPLDAYAECQKYWYFPVERITHIKSISFDFYLEVGGSLREWAFGIIGIAWINDNNEMQNYQIDSIGNFGSQTYDKSGQWVHKEYDFTNVGIPRMDYLDISTAQSIVKLKNIKITYGP